MIECFQLFVVLVKRPFALTYYTVNYHLNKGKNHILIRCSPFEGSFLEIVVLVCETATPFVPVWDISGECFLFRAQGNN